MPASGRWLVAGLVCLLLSRAEGQGPTNVNMVVTNNATVEWIWGTQFMFTATAAGNGAVGGDSNGWYDLGTNVEVVAEPARYHHFVSWSGDVPPESGTGAVLRLSLDQPRTVAAFFAENLATNGTPEWWLAAHGLTNGDWDVIALADSDKDGMWNWQEWIAGTDPTNARSLLSISQVMLTAGGRLPLTFAGVTGRIYQAWQSSSLAETNWAVAPHAYTDVGALNTDPIPGADATVTTFVQPDGTTRFYRIGVQKE